MAIITISRGSYSHGKEVAEKVAKKLGLECISREVILEASKQYNIPEFKLLRAIQDPPSFFDRITGGKEKYVAYVKAVLLKHLKRDNVVYHGFAGHFFVANVPGILKVRIIADIEERARLVMERNGISREEAIDFLNRLDADRRRWGQRLYSIDTTDPSLYDLIIHIGQIKIDDAVDLVCYASEMKCFKITQETRSMLEDLAIAAEVQACVMEIKPDAVVSCNDGIVQITIRMPIEMNESQMVEKIKNACKNIEGIKEIRISTKPMTLFRS